MRDYQCEMLLNSLLREMRTGFKVYPSTCLLTYLNMSPALIIFQVINAFGFVGYKGCISMIKLSKITI
jgi:hypothetical protein